MFPSKEINSMEDIRGADLIGEIARKHIIAQRMLQVE